MSAVSRYLPFLTWVPNLTKADLKADAVAGLTVAVMLVPQGMAYAMLAGLPPIYGLYASIVPLVVYALFGTSRELAVGPVAMVSLLTATGVGAIAEVGTETYLLFAVLLAFMVGLIQTAMGVLRLGFLVNFLSHPVLSGFTSAAALIIGFSQLKHLLGVDIPRSHHVHTIIWQAILRASEINPATLGIGVASVAALLIIKRVKRSFPGALAVVVLGALAVFGLDLQAHGVKIVGDIPAGLPAPSIPAFSWSTMQALLPTALVIAFVGFMESISVAKVFASKRRYEIDANQELLGLGLANLFGSFFHAFPVTGGFSRTAVKAQAGARTAMTSVFTASFVALTALLLTSSFYYLPNAVLAAIIMTAVAGLVDIHEVKHLWKVKKSDLVLLVITFAATLMLGIEQGILTGVGTSLVWFVVRTTRPHFAVLGRLPGAAAYRNVANHPEAQTFDGLLIVRMDAQFYFGNVNFLKEKLRSLESASGGRLEHVIIDASAMNSLDSSADAALHELARGYGERGIGLHLANVKQPVATVLRLSGFVERFGADRLFVDVESAVRAVCDGCLSSPATPAAPASEVLPLPVVPPSPGLVASPL